jgi:23S rRNA (guanine2445-N2)-methyltransferase / 23S rRNA (guanine2069-N7)-methyltransferase
MRRAQSVSTLSAKPAVKIISQRKIKCFIACAPGLEKLLAAELKRLCEVDSKVRRAGIDCVLTQPQIYRFCLWSRLANRVLYPLAGFAIDSEKTYYTALKDIDWSRHVNANGSIAVDFFSANSCITHSRYGAQLTKDAVVDWFREKYNERPGVDRETPDIRINVYLFKNRARVSLDMSGQSLHRRNYRTAGGSAPLKENLAAAILLASRWVPHKETLVDPMCGSATLLIEGAMIAGNIAPGLQRDYFGFLGWRKHDHATWAELIAEAQAQKKLADIPAISGFDIDVRAVEVAKNNIAAAGLSDVIEVEAQDFFADTTPLAGAPGMVVTNPPYGERLEEKAQLGQFYGRLGRALKQRAGGWRLALFTVPSLQHRTGIDAKPVLTCSNGGIDCQLFSGRIPASRKRVPAMTSADPVKAGRSAVATKAGQQTAPGISQFADRLRKNLRQIKGWAKSVGATNYRVYDADLPDYAFALDVYHDVNPAKGPYVCLQEYRPPAQIDKDLAELRLASAAQVVIEQLSCVEDNLAVKRRDRQRGDQQYQRIHRSDVFHQVAEGDCKLLINLHDYLDCGLFLDHRKVRHWIGSHADGARFLNLYCYTAAATVHAIGGGVRESVSVDLSQRYLAWAQENMAANGFESDRHRLVRADCSSWIDQYIARGDSQPFDMIFLDPPTFSNSSATANDWDVQRDHASMIERCMTILSPAGTLIFSNNFRRFKLSEQIPAKYTVQDKTRWSLQRDFSRSSRIHQCWFIRHAG